MLIIIVIVFTSNLYTTELIRGLFQEVYYSPNGSNSREMEESTYILFVDLLNDVETAESLGSQGISYIY